MQARFPLLCLCLLALLSAPAATRAAPETYGLTSGTLQIQANRASDNALVIDETVTLRSTSFVVFDPTGVPSTFGTGTLDAFLLDADPDQGLFSPLVPWGPFGSFVIDSLVIEPGLGYLPILGFMTVPGTWTSQAGPVDITPVFNGDALAPLSAFDLSGTLELVPGTELLLDGLVQATLDGTPYGEPGNDLTFTFNITLSADSAVEPASPPVPAIGLLGLSAVFVALALGGAAGLRGRRHR